MDFKLDRQLQISGNKFVHRTYRKCISVIYDDKIEMLHFATNDNNNVEKLPKSECTVHSVNAALVRRMCHAGYLAFSVDFAN